MRISSADCPGIEVLVPLLMFIVFALCMFFYAKLINTLKEEKQSVVWFFLVGINCLLPQYTKKEGTKWRVLLFTGLGVFTFFMVLVKAGHVCSG